MKALRLVPLRLLQLVVLITTATVAAQTVATTGETGNTTPISTGTATIGTSSITQSSDEATTKDASGIYNPTVCGTATAPYWCNGAIIASQSPGSGYSGNWTCIVTGGTVASGGHAAACSAYSLYLASGQTSCSFRAPCGLGLYISDPGVYSAQPTGITFSGGSYTAGVPATVKLQQGSDLGVWVNAAFAACSSISPGNINATSGCMVRIPAGNYSYSTTIQMPFTTESLIGAGPWNTVLTYKGTGDAIHWQMNPWTVAKAGTLKGFYLQCTANAANCVHSGTLIGSTWEDLVISGATKSGASNVLLENTQEPACFGQTTCTLTPGWTEQTYMHNVKIGDQTSPPGGNVNLHFTVNRARPGTGSFAYSDISIWQWVDSGQTGVLFDNGAYVYNSDITIKGNITARPVSTTYYFYVNGAQVVYDHLHVFGETSYIPPPPPHPNYCVPLVTVYGQVFGSGEFHVSCGTSQLMPPKLLGLTNGTGFSVEPWNAYDAPGFTKNGSFPQPFEKSFQLVSDDDASLVALQGNGDLSGRLVLSWPHKGNRYQQMVIEVACASHDTSACTMNIPNNYAYQNEYVVTNARLVDLPSGVVQLLVSVGNRNGISQNLTASWFGSDDEAAPVLFPSVNGQNPPNTGIGTIPVGLATNKFNVGSISDTGPSQAAINSNNGQYSSLGLNVHGLTQAFVIANGTSEPVHGIPVGATGISTTNQSFSVATGGAERMHIDTSGNVGGSSTTGVASGKISLTPGPEAYGTATLSSGVVTVTNLAACAPSSSCVYKLTNCGKNSSTAIGILSISSVTPGVSFVVTALTATGSAETGDDSTVCWQIN